MTVITDDTPAAEIELAITGYNNHAKRQQHHRDCAAWNKDHARIDALLTDWQAARDA